MKQKPASLDAIPITLIGHPWAPIGMGEQLRSHVASLSALHLHHGVLDIFRYAARTDLAHDAIIGTRELFAPPDGIRIFHVNGDEVDPVIAAFEARGGVFDAGTNVIVPAWELPAYPAAWVPALHRFDEVWALSGFIQAGLAAAGLDSHLVGQSVQPLAGATLPRRHFGIRESAFVLLNFFDLSSYASRKNPEGVLALFDRLREADPYADIQLVLKVKDGERGAETWARDTLAARGNTHQLLVLDRPLDTLGVRSLITACDCFISLHRAEGFGRGLGEAMALGRLALGTDWSGSTDFLNQQNGLPVRHRMRALEPGDYPHWQDQHWAEPDIDHAASLLTPFLRDPVRGRTRALRGQSDILHSHGNRATGLRMLAHLERIAAGG